MKTETKREKKIRRHKRIRAKIYGTAARPRLCVFRSNRYIYAQLIDDEKGKTLIALSDREFKMAKAAAKEKEKEGGVVRSGKIAKAFELGKAIAKKILENKIEKVVFDRGGYKYHGRVKGLADGAREGGLKF